MAKLWKLYKFNIHDEEAIDQRVADISSKEGWYRRERDNLDADQYRLSNNIKYIYLSGYGEFHQYYVSNVELYSEDLVMITERERMDDQILPIHTEVALDVQIGREFFRCEQPKLNKKILVVDDSSFQQRIFSVYLRLYDVTTTDHLSLVSNEYNLIILSGKYCLLEIDHDKVLRYKVLIKEDDPENCIYMPLTEDKLLRAPVR